MGEDEVADGPPGFETGNPTPQQLERVAGWVRSVRKHALRQSQPQFAALTRTSPATISRIENEKPVSADVISKIAASLPEDLGRELLQVAEIDGTWAGMRWGDQSWRDHLDWMSDASGATASGRPTSAGQGLSELEDAELDELIRQALDEMKRRRQQ